MTDPAHPTRAPQAPGAPHSPHPAPEVGSGDREAPAGATAMRDEEVPDELLALAKAAGNDYDQNVVTFRWEGYQRATLAAVLPAHEAMVRAKVAEELHAEGQRLHDCGWHATGGHYVEAARFVRDEA